jgi:hypothetical protein
MRPSLFKNILNDIRQWCYPSEFRIPRPAGRPFADDINAVLKTLSEAIHTLSAEAPISGNQPSGSAVDDERFICDLSTRLWRLRNSLQQPGSQEAVPGVERGYRHLERLLFSLENLGIRIVDRTGSFYDPGMALKVVSSEPMDGIGSEIIKETICPAVYRDEKLIQVPQVVVGIPSNAVTDSEADNHPTTEFEPGMDQNPNIKPGGKSDETTAPSE